MHDKLLEVLSGGASVVFVESSSLEYFAATSFLNSRRCYYLGVVPFQWYPFQSQLQVGESAESSTADHFPEDLTVLRRELSQLLLAVAEMILTWWLRGKQVEEVGH